jgi:thiamine-phosphate pyrophosphorylase
MPQPLHAIVDVEAADRAGWRPAPLARAFLDGGARLLQLRAKGLPSGAFLDLCDEVVALARAAEAQVIVNDRVDLARLSGAAGVHVGQDDLRPADARAVLGDAAVVGLSTHSVSQIEASLHEPVTSIAIGPVFGTHTKDTGYAAVGLARVSDAARRSGGRPVVAIGGITLDTAAAVRAAGATAVAVIGDLLVGRPDVRVRAFLTALRQE